ncbi:MAG: HAD family phosphatase [Syntrophobacterales bacterium]|jgi:phosphoglycolate phosphatase/putative hydrolase of the HAD superfamily|nr:HAD family phosphatase [Syntrophobacterales bacterium]
MTTPAGIPQAVIFDVDGTLYDQRRLRLWMLREMFRCVLSQPARLAELRILWLFRTMREKHAAEAAADLESRQYAWAAQAAGVSPEKVRDVVKYWMFERPLAYLRSCRYPGAQALFSQFQEQGIPIGVFSDYPALDKLRTLELTAQVVVSATCPEVSRLKPDPAGLLVAAAKLGAPPPECLFIGDQEAKDGECARRAGMPHLILAARQKNRHLHGLAVWLKDAQQS